MSGTVRLVGAVDAAFVAARGALLRYLRARGAGDDAEDILQDLWLRLAALEPDAGEIGTPYLLRMAHNLLVDRYRSRSRRETREASYQATVPDTTPSAEDVADARDRLLRVDRALKALGARTDHVFRRHRIEHAPQRAIAQELGISVSAVEKHLQKAYRAVATLARHDREERA